MDLEFTDKLGKRFDEMIFAYQKYLYVYLRLRLEKMNAPFMDLPDKEVSLIHVLTLFGTMSMGNLAKKSGISPKCLYRHIDTLIEHGYAVRSQDARNRKIVNVALTEKAKEDKEKYTAMADGIVCELLNASMNDEEQLGLLQAVTDLTARLEKLRVRSSPTTGEQTT